MSGYALDAERRCREVIMGSSYVAWDYYDIEWNKDNGFTYPGKSLVLWDSFGTTDIELLEVEQQRIELLLIIEKYGCTTGCKIKS